MAMDPSGFIAQTNDPHYLHTTSKRLVHPFKGINELIDNSLDAGASKIEICGLSKRYMHVTDDGDGCDGDGINSMLSFGKSLQRDGRIGQYGEGHKTAVMKLGPDSLVLSQPKVSDGYLRVAGLLSRTLHSDTDARAIVLPIVQWKRKGSDWKLHSFRGAEPRLCLDNILKYSRHKTEAGLMTAFETAFGSKGSGLRIEIRMSDDALEPTTDDFVWNSESEQIMFDNFEYLTSLREYIRVTYGICRFKNFSGSVHPVIKLQGETVKLKEWHKELYHVQEFKYHPRGDGPLSELLKASPGGINILCGFVSHLVDEPGAVRTKENEFQKPEGSVILGRFRAKTGKFHRAVDLFKPITKCDTFGIISRQKRGCGAVIISEVPIDSKATPTGLIPNTNKVGLTDNSQYQHFVNYLSKKLPEYAKKVVTDRERMTALIALCGPDDNYTCGHGGSGDLRDPHSADNEFGLEGCTLKLPPALIGDDPEPITKQEYDRMDVWYCRKCLQKQQRTAKRKMTNTDKPVKKKAKQQPPRQQAATQVRAAPPEQQSQPPGPRQPTARTTRNSRDNWPGGSPSMPAPPEQPARGQSQRASRTVSQVAQSTRVTPQQQSTDFYGASSSNQMKKLQEMKKLLPKLMQHDSSGNFNFPLFHYEGLSKAYLKRYAKVVTSPMDLQTVTENLMDNVYATCQECAADISKVFNNCISANGLATEEGHEASTMLRYFNNLYRRIEPRDVHAEHLVKTEEDFSASDEDMAEESPEQELCIDPSEGRAMPLSPTVNAQLKSLDALKAGALAPVSYTHLTLPTKRIV
eukprot:TRINITY_DN32430_c0_g1_i3.p1 TRINITY_DN32430_c0_g1~~TRINITY_DN32430_c0_g1_i3.p1  ORF type:complete len:804 (+),score=91.07 TRINITY_DN32430_c0_g1_i3:190-2601(+)